MWISSTIWDKRKKRDIIFLTAGFFLLAALIISVIGSFTAKPAISITDSDESIFVIDAGHGFPDGGASSSTGVVESDLNLKISKRLDAMLRFVGGNTLMIREDENSIYDPTADTIREKKRTDLKNRVNIINGTPDAVLISIHQNYFTDSKYYGAQVFHAADELSTKLGIAIQRGLRVALDKDNKREAKKIPSSVYLFKKLNCPGILIECGFLSNDNEVRLLQSEGYQKKLAMSVVSSILTFDAASES